MKLPETDPAVFEIFYGWFYRQKIWDKDAKEEHWSDPEDLAKLYVFADMARIPFLQNQASKAIHKISDTHNFPHSIIDYFGDSIASTSSFRRYFIDLVD
jgi:hypothetical protein